MTKNNDLTGSKFGRWTVLSRGGRDKHRNPLWLCECECGIKRLVTGASLRRGRSNSCGCLGKENRIKVMTVHGQGGRVNRSDEYKIWDSMMQRCYNENEAAYKHYGGRGIKVCDRWRRSFSAFYEDMGARPSKHHTLERLDNSQDYEPSNCKWATWQEQNRNKRLNKNNTSGHRGVSKDKKNGKWHAYIYAGKRIHLGYFDSLEEAIKARREGERKYW